MPSEPMIRASLDQILLAIDAADRGKFDETRVRTDLSVALRNSNGSGVGPAQGGRFDPRIETIEIIWRDQIRSLDPNAVVEEVSTPEEVIVNPENRSPRGPRGRSARTGREHSLSPEAHQHSVQPRRES